MIGGVAGHAGCRPFFVFSDWYSLGPKAAFRRDVSPQDQ